NGRLALVGIRVCSFVLPLRGGEQGFEGCGWLGFATMAITTSSLSLLSSWGVSEDDWPSATILRLVAVVIVGALLTVFIESRAAQPLIPVLLFKNRNMVLTTLAGTVLGLAMMGVLGYMPTYLQMVHPLTPTEAGLM